MDLLSARITWPSPVPPNANSGNQIRNQKFTSLQVYLTKETESRAHSEDRTQFVPRKTSPHPIVLSHPQCQRFVLNFANKITNIAVDHQPTALPKCSRNLISVQYRTSPSQQRQSPP